MAIYHLSAKIISRGKGQSAVASASYRSGERLQDERTGETKYYKREVQPETMILAPSQAPDWVYNRERLWNEVERSETRVNSRLAREMEIALPVELSNEQQKELIKKYVQEQFVNHGMIADIAIHRDNKENPHAHVMLTTREISQEGFTDKNRDWNKKERLQLWRKEWSNYANKELEKVGSVERIDHRSYEAQKLEIKPTKHLGHEAHAMEKRGIKTEIGNYNRDVKSYNNNVYSLEQYRQEKAEILKAMQKKEQQQLTREEIKKNPVKPSALNHSQNEKTKTGENKYLKPYEVADIKKAVSVTKEYVTLENIKQHKQDISERLRAISEGKGYIYRTETSFQQARQIVDRSYKDEQVKELLNHKLADKQQELSDTLNPFKRKTIKQDIERLQKEKEQNDRNREFTNNELEPYRKELNFKTIAEFESKETEFRKNKPIHLNKLLNTQKDLQNSKEILEKAEKSLQRGEVRKMIEPYSDIRHLGEKMKYRDASQLKDIQEHAQKPINSFQELKTDLQDRQQTIRNAEKRLNTIDHEQQRLERAERNYARLDIIQEKINKHDGSLLSKGKRVFSSEVKQEYETLLSQRDQLQNALNKDQLPDKKAIDHHRKEVERMQSVERPQLEKEVKQAKEQGKHGVDIERLQKTVETVERAEREQQRHKERQRYQGREKEMELDR